MVDDTFILYGKNYISLQIMSLNILTFYFIRLYDYYSYYTAAILIFKIIYIFKKMKLIYLDKYSI